MFNTQFCINEVLLLNLRADVTCMLGATSDVAALLPSVNSQELICRFRASYLPDSM